MMDITLTPDYPAEVMQARRRYGIVGNSQELNEAIMRAVRVAPIDLSVLVMGESGTGKEFFPKIIHGFSARKHAGYIAVNCGAIPEGTIDSELFGHEKGAFTGAVNTRKGYFEEADGGTIFLDEVAELPLTTQARLLRVLESGEFMKVGSSTVQKANVRIVAATNVDMVRAVADGKFREDLYYRLSTVTINVPPLRERGADVILLARKFAADFAERYTMPSVTLDDSARAMLMTYRWPGNVRQLKNVIEQTALFHAGETVSSFELRGYLPSTDMGLATIPAPSDGRHSYEAEREMLLGMMLRMQQQIDSLRESINLSSPKSEVSAGIVDTTVRESHLPVKFEPFCSPLPEVVRPASQPVEVSATVPTTLEETERDTIMRALERNGGRRKATAAELNISERTLYRKIKRLFNNKCE
ncbi:MAG: sigma-54 dependent transcriptional regulator [Muribaculaceae bacterium]|nr:sigma-54 dependent transcriptional regulator [Muribaculaceae bacterium]